MKWLKNLVLKIAARKVATAIGMEDGPMNDKKEWWKSKTVWTGIVTVLIGLYDSVNGNLAGQFGWNLPEIPTFVYSVLGAIGVYTRAVATKTIG